VIQADGGTRTAAVTGSWIALYAAFAKVRAAGRLQSVPLNGQVAAISCGIYQGTPVLDLDYAEDSNADADANFVLTASGQIVEVQGTAEKDPFSDAQFAELFRLARKGIADLATMQRHALGLV
jgi:ribonuclease PH